MDKTLFEHQRDAVAFLRTKPHPQYAALDMEMGTGKSRVVLEEAQQRYKMGDINSLLILCPNGVQQNWILDEVSKWVEQPHRAAYYRSAMNAEERRAMDLVHAHPGPILRIWAFNIESLRNKVALGHIRAILKHTECMMVIDESHRIKGHKTAVTKSAHKLAQSAKYRRILSGTMAPNGPLDLWAQYTFLSPHILRYPNFYSFRSAYAQMKTIPVKGRDVNVVVGYRHLDDLSERIDPHTFRAKKSECLDLPERTYETVSVEWGSHQQRMYKQMLEDSVVDLGDVQGASAEEQLLNALDSEDKSKADNALTKILRLQQITGGWLRGEDGEYHPTNSRKLATLQDRLQDLNGKAIIWANFKPELEAIHKALTAEDPERAVLYTGDTASGQRYGLVRKFQENPRCRYFVGYPGAGGIGINLTAANQVLWYSLMYRLDYYLQANDRAHRIGQRSSVTYTHLLIPGTIDAGIYRRLKEKAETMNQLRGVDK